MNENNWQSSGMFENEEEYIKALVDGAEDVGDEDAAIDRMMEWEEECNHEPMVEPNVTVDDMREWM